MNGLIERLLFIGVIAAMGVMLVKEGRTQTRLENQIPVKAERLYDQMAEGKAIQIIDIRPLVDEDDEDVGGYEELHIPNAIPFPNCTKEGTPANALGYMQLGVPTVIVSLDGDQDALKKCKMFSRGQRLIGGMLAWDEEGFPEAEDEFVVPSKFEDCLGN